MSNYEEEHNLNNRSVDGSLSSSRERNASEDRPDHERHPTLQQALDNFLNTPSYSTTNIVNFNRESLQASGLAIEPQMLEMLQSLVTSSNGVISFQDSAESKGVDDSFLDTLERVNVKKLKDDDTCPICTNDYKSDKHPLVVELPCNSQHRFDLECIGPWLKLNRTCPLCRTDVTVKKNKVELVDSEEEDEGWDMYG
ncbi:hypothetical protein PICMEDRAFT_73696 [Pichia membranifaciens NRRL Y-2026]|uniref:RING-type domain-containing protein n=1 Tax=Pichia membranifaciens NRRL Y-2026 TaxID=763406 RepID=A0A1E3NH46_9ASCO|nr:hypothetical protein PICMEDRAFT_73696 [Pichia membranifaciens NRRL Y-2026]ODQ44888.1 hypothetical protein PICMEDRAFT_73696 [Pichia membranifaciens NRRL Y-2026]